MKPHQILIKSAALVVFAICLYCFFLGNGMAEGTFENDEVAWYFLAKGIFCSLSLFLSVDLLEAIRCSKDKHRET